MAEQTLEHAQPLTVLADDDNLISSETGKIPALLVIVQVTV